MNQQLYIDTDLCQGHGWCYRILPALLTEDEAGFVTQRGARVGVPEQWAAAAAATVDSCPEGAIRLDDA